MSIKSFALTTSAAILGLAGSMVSTEAAAHAPTPAGKEKCYGIAKGGKNDCGWSGGSCAGSAKVSGNKEAWIFVPTGTCAKIINGSLKPSKGFSTTSATQVENVTIINNPTRPITQQPPVVKPPKPTTPTDPVVTPTTPEVSESDKKVFERH